MIIEAILFLLVLGQNVGFFDSEDIVLVNPKKVYFLGNLVEPTKWNNLQKRVNCFAGLGDWEASQLNRLHVNCDNAFAHAGECGRSNVSKVNFDWKASSPDCTEDAVFQRFTAKDMCEIMDGKNLMVVGDSLSTEFSVSLKNRFYEGAQEDCHETCWHLCEHHFTMPCENFFGKNHKNFKLSDFRNDRLSLTKVKYHNYTENFLENVWFNQIGEHNVDVVLLNRGAHYEPIEVVLNAINTTITALRNAHHLITIVWRNTPRGHTPAELADHFFGAPLSKGYIAPVALPYNWDKIFAQNEIIRTYLLEYFPGVLYLDVATSTSLRADSHMDGLHYCIPGPVDNWVNLFLQSMKIAQSALK